MVNKRWGIQLLDLYLDLSLEEILSIMQVTSCKKLSKSFIVVKTTELKIKKLVSYSFSYKRIIENPKITLTENLVKFDQLRKINFTPKIDPKLKRHEFDARFFHIENPVEKDQSMKIERNLGAYVLEQDPKYKVNLSNPNLTYAAISWGTEVAFGWLYSIKKFSDIAWRAPKESPYFRGGGMKPRLCRLMVNLTFPHPAVILDPFGGHGGILREIADIGSFGIGIELSKKISREMQINNRHFLYDELIAIILGDSLRPPLRKSSVKTVVTDPPYAIQTTTSGVAPNDLILNWVEKIDPGTKVVITTPNEMIDQFPDFMKLEVDGRVYVHKSLTRRVRKFIRN